MASVGRGPAPRGDVEVFRELQSSLQAAPFLAQPLHPAVEGILLSSAQASGWSSHGLREGKLGNLGCTYDVTFLTDIFLLHRTPSAFAASP